MVSVIHFFSLRCICQMPVEKYVSPITFLVLCFSCDSKRICVRVPSCVPWAGYFTSFINVAYINECFYLSILLAMEVNYCVPVAYFIRIFYTMTPPLNLARCALCDINTLRPRIVQRFKSAIVRISVKATESPRADITVNVKNRRYALIYMALYLRD